MFLSSSFLLPNRKGLASLNSSIQCQACVANILVPICHSSTEQKLLCQAGAIPLLARLINERYHVLQIPALKCLCKLIPSDINSIQQQKNGCKSIQVDDANTCYV